jgi:hypothetical protein
VTFQSEKTPVNLRMGGLGQRLRFEAFLLHSFDPARVVGLSEEEAVLVSRLLFFLK